MYISGGTSIDEIITDINNSINLINSTLGSHTNSINSINTNISNINANINNINTSLSYKYFASGWNSENIWTFIWNLRKGRGQCGSVELTSTSTVGSVTVASGWYNFLWIPHRSGGIEADNYQYGNLILFPMNFNNVSYICRYSTEQFASIKTFG